MAPAKHTRNSTNGKNYGKDDLENQVDGDKEIVIDVTGSQDIAKTQESIGSVNSLTIENCYLKNIQHDLESKIKSIESANAAIITQLKKEVDSLKTTNESLKKQHHLSLEIVKCNEALQKDNKDLGKKILALKESVALQGDMKKKISALTEEVERNGKLLQNLETVKEQNINLKKELEAANSTIEYLKQNIISEKLASTLYKSIDKVSSNDDSSDDNPNAVEAILLEQSVNKRIKKNNVPQGHQKQPQHHRRNNWSKARFYNSRFNVNGPRDNIQAPLKNYDFANRSSYHRRTSRYDFESNNHPYQDSRRQK